MVQKIIKEIGMDDLILVGLMIVGFVFLVIEIRSNLDGQCKVKTEKVISTSEIRH